MELKVMKKHIKKGKNEFDVFNGVNPNGRWVSVSFSDEALNKIAKAEITFPCFLYDIEARVYKKKDENGNIIKDKKNNRACLKCYIIDFGKSEIANSTSMTEEEINAILNEDL